MTASLQIEASAALASLGGPAWQNITIKSLAQEVAVRMASSIFGGHELAESEQWLQLFKTYTDDLYTAMNLLERFPRPLRKHIYRCFMHSFVVNREHLRLVRSLSSGARCDRYLCKKESVASGQGVPEFIDATAYIVECPKTSGHSVANIQATCMVTVIHIMEVLLDHVLLNLARNPIYIQPIRNQIVDALEDAGWQPESLDMMDLLDKQIQDAQDDIAGKGRGLVAKVWSTVLPKKSMEELLRTHGGHFGFGNAKYAELGKRCVQRSCLKIALCHLLMKYDWEAVDPALEEETVQEKSTAPELTPLAKVMIRLRDYVELDIDTV
ncbi:Uu.00g041940.m01.CDS01 [Anthostomella pinea]|uniref:Uu.00g041940.m01.CDS01 n=1 Tax=Anthostomella pinea TaxID=933095 RepID=A0AAI8VBH8_9PEZI|nr:Uu.00g041940.m01.CDS01 [Anthostomella pinea]